METDEISYPAMTDIWKASQAFPHADWNDALSKGQSASKLWLVQNLDQIFSGETFQCVYVLAGWYGLLGRLILDEVKNVEIKMVRSFDMDPECEPIADSVNKFWIKKNWRFKAATVDITHINYLKNIYKVKNSRNEISELVETPDMIINTSCEHIEKFDRWYEGLPGGIPILLQSNNYFSGRGHINCTNSLEMFMDRAPMAKILFKGTLDLQKYQRYMIFGYKA